MNYFLTINRQPPLPCDDLAKTLTQIGEAIQRGYLHRTDAAGNSIYIKLGAGSIIALVSEEAMQEKRKEKRDAQQRAQGLIVPGGDSRKESWRWRLVVQFDVAGQILQLEPIPYENHADAVAAVERSLAGEVIRQVIEDEHDYIWVFPGQNVTYLVMSQDHLVQQQRMALEMQSRMASANARQQLGGLPKIIR